MGSIHWPTTKVCDVNEAGWPRRIGAFLIDWTAALLTAKFFVGTAIPPDNVKENLIICAFFVVEVGVLAGLLGVSLGKFVFRIAIVNADYKPIGILRALLRTAMICLVIPVVLITDRQRGLHDVAVGSIAIRS